MNYIKNHIWDEQGFVEDCDLSFERPIDSAKKQLDYLCRYFGSSYEGRRNAAMKFLHIKQMVPILISQERSLIVFPTQGCDEIACIWVNYSNLKNVISLDDRRTMFVFQDEEQLLVHMEYRSACTQIQRCSLFLYMMGCHRNMDIMEVLHQGGVS